MKLKAKTRLIVGGAIAAALTTVAALPFFTAISYLEYTEKYPADALTIAKFQEALQRNGSMGTKLVTGLGGRPMLVAMHKTGCGLIVGQHHLYELAYVKTVDGKPVNGDARLMLSDILQASKDAGCDSRNIQVKPITRWFAASK